MKDIYVVGLDISLTGTGLVFADPKEETIEPYLIKSKPETDWYHRCKTISDRIMELTSSKYPGVNILYTIENFAFGVKHSSSVFQIAELSGIIRYRLRYEWKVPHSHILLVPPTTLKSFITGKGNAPKELMLKEVYRRWGFDTSDNNIADAYALMKYGRAAIGHDPCTKEQCKVMRKLITDQHLDEKGELYGVL